GHQRLAVFLGQDSGQNLHRVRLAALGDETRPARPAPVKLGLNVANGEPDAGRAPIDYAADRRTMAFAPRGDAKQMTESVVRHRCFFPRGAVRFYGAFRMRSNPCTERVSTHFAFLMDYSHDRSSQTHSRRGQICETQLLRSYCCSFPSPPFPPRRKAP